MESTSFPTYSSIKADNSNRKQMRLTILACNPDLLYNPSNIIKISQREQVHKVSSTVHSSEITQTGSNNSYM